MPIGSRPSCRKRTDFSVSSTATPKPWSKARKPFAPCSRAGRAWPTPPTRCSLSRPMRRHCPRRPGPCAPIVITPFDRGDIKDLINTLDDTIDQMQKTARAVLLFEVDTLEPRWPNGSAHSGKRPNLTVEAVRMMAALRENVARLNTITEQIIHLEEDSDALNHKGIKALFLRYRGGNAMNYLVGVEIYDHSKRSWTASRTWPTVSAAS